MTPSTNLPPSGNPPLSSQAAVVFRRKADGILVEVGEGIEHWTGYSAAEIQSNPELFESVLVPEGKESPQNNPLPGGERATSQSGRFFCLKHRATGMIRRIWEVKQGSEGGIWVDVSFMERVRARMWDGLWKETLAKLTCGFVHDLNNILAGIGSLSELSLMEMAEEDPMYSNLKLLKENTYRATRLTEQLTRLLHAKKGRPNYHDLNQVITETCVFLKAAIPRNIECVKELVEESLPVYVDERELQQVIISLIFNGAEAIEGKGRIILRTASHQEMPPQTLVCGKVIEGNCVSLTVEDSGPGLNPGVLGNLAAMDYTTNPGGGGIGLGLAHAAAFCKEAGTALSVGLEPGRGGIMVLWMPKADMS